MLEQREKSMSSSMDEWRKFCEEELQRIWDNYGGQWDFFETEFLEIYQELIGQRTVEEIIILFDAVPEFYKGGDGGSPLHIAVKVDNDEVIRDLIAHFHECIDTFNGFPFPLSPLTRAINKRHEKVLKALLEAGASVSNELYADKCGPFEAAGYLNSFETVRMLLEAGADANRLGGNLQNSLHEVFTDGRDNRNPLEIMKIVQILMDYGANINQVSLLGETPLYRAIEFGYFDIANMLLDAGACASLADSNLDTPLHSAAQHGHVELTKRLLKCDGVHINALNKQKRNPLYFAIRRKRYEVVQVLIDAGALTEPSHAGELAIRHDGNEYIRKSTLFYPFLSRDVRNSDEFQNYLQLAAEYGCKDIFLNLLRYGGDLCGRNVEGETLLHYTARPSYSDDSAAIERRELIKFILSETSGIMRYSSSELLTILERTVIFADEEIVRSLLKLLGDLSQYPTSTFHELSVSAVVNPRTRVIKLIHRSVKVDINAKNKLGITALSKAIIECIPSTIKFLIKMGADTDECMRLALNRTIPEKNKECVRLLLMYKPDIDIESKNSFDGESAVEIACRIFRTRDAFNKKIALYLVRHVAFLEEIGKPVREESLRVINSSPDLQNYYKICQTELKFMREHRMCKSFTFFDALNPVKLYSCNSYVPQSSIAHKKFDCIPIYADWVEHNCMKMQKRLKLVECARIALGHILQCDPYSQIIVIDEILGYLNNKDLRKLMEIQNDV